MRQARNLLLFAISLFGIIIFSYFTSAALGTNLRYYWGFNENTSTTANDQQGLNPITLNSASMWNSSCLIGTCVHTNSGALNGTAGQLNGFVGNYSISLWIKYVDTSYTGAFIGNSLLNAPSASGDFFMESSPTGQIDFRTQGTTSYISPNNKANNAWHHYVFVNNNGSNMMMYEDSVNVKNGTSSTFTNFTSNANFFIFQQPAATNAFTDAAIDEMGIWNRTLNVSDVAQLYNSGAGLPYSSIVGSTGLGLTSTLVSPINNTQLSTSGTNFSASYTASVGNITNATYFIWLTNGTLFNMTSIINLNGTSNSTSLFIDNFTLFTPYLWNVQVCGTNATSNFCNLSVSNYSFNVGYSLNSVSYANVSYETNYENINLTIGVLSSSLSVVATLNYSGNIYNSMATCGLTTCIISNGFDIPLNTKTQQNNSFYWNINLTDTVLGTSLSTTTSSYNHSVKALNFSLCPQLPINVTYLNFTTKNETAQTVQAATFLGTFNYWLGKGTVQRNYSINDQSGGNSTFTFCYNPDNSTIYTDADIVYSANGFAPNGYSMRNASLNNITTQTDLFLLDSSKATKFYVVIKKGVNPTSQALITVSKYFTGLGSYKTDSVRVTDDTGQIPLYAEVDGKYRFAIVNNGTLLGVFDRIASCSTAPCEIDINIENSLGNIYSGYSNQYGGNIISNISFNSTTNIVTYNFLDLTGTAHYFRLQVLKNILNGTIGQTICDQNLYSSFGSMTCNVTGYKGDFVANTYVSRSPEKLDKVFGFIISDIVNNLGFMGLFLNFAILLTMILGAAVITKGSPSGVVFVGAVTVLLLKVGGLFPLTWIVTICIEAMLVFMLTKLKT